LYDFFPEDFLVIVDESHVTVPQIRAMYAGDQSRKKTLVSHGFRLPSALDNRPLQFEEWEEKTNQAVYVSATPNDYELEKTGGEVVEQIIRPTGLLDPEVEVVPARGQVAHLLEAVRERAARDERILVTALTKRLAEDLAGYLTEQNVRCRWLHSELDAFERVELLHDLRQGKFDCLVGVNLLREGLDLPEVSMVAILDADKEGFLRSETSLIQTIGRAARNANSKVILYADRITDSMRFAIDETARRRQLQEKFNLEHGITPETVRRHITAGIESAVKAGKHARSVISGDSGGQVVTEEYLESLEKEMLQAAEDLEFERAASLRDKIHTLRDKLGETVTDSDGPSEQPKGKRGRRKKGVGRKVPRPKRG
jgi:excinuclease ABC subunit B